MHLTYRWPCQDVPKISGQSKQVTQTDPAAICCAHAGVATTLDRSAHCPPPPPPPLPSAAHTQAPRVPRRHHKRRSAHRPAAHTRALRPHLVATRTAALPPSATHTRAWRPHSIAACTAAVLPSAAHTRIAAALDRSTHCRRPVAICHAHASGAAALDRTPPARHLLCTRAERPRRSRVRDQRRRTLWPSVPATLACSRRRALCSRRRALRPSAAAPLELACVATLDCCAHRRRASICCAHVCVAAAHIAAHTAAVPQSVAHTCEFWYWCVCVCAP
jgi:hypothetical protein